MTTHLAPEIKQYFDRLLLSTPCPKFNDDISRINRMFKYIENKLLRRCKDEYQKREIEELLKQYREKHGRIVKKEKDLETEERHATKEPFYNFTMPSKRDGFIFNRLRFKG